MYYNGIC